MKLPLSNPTDGEYRAAINKIAAKWPDLSPGAFIEEVRASFYPKPDEYELLTKMWEMFSDGTLLFTSERKVRLP